jgi:tetratricopeptide (TPR) repeat protein
MFRKLLSLTVFSIALLTVNAQQPVLKISGADSNRVKLNRLDLDVQIAGNIATTTITMRFCNGSNRVLEGELTFPMPEGVSISRFALDINGKMREAVPVEKEKGQVVFENIERRNVDPGLLEKTEGNNFRTRIYPIPANGCRTVLIAYEQELQRNTKNALLYSLPMHFNYPIKEFAASFNVYSSATPEIGSDCASGMRFDSLKNVFQAKTLKNNFTPDGSFQLMMPVLENDAEVMMQQVNGKYYFMINTYPSGKIEEKKMPAAISILWDVSLSGRLRNQQKEFELLDKYLKQAGNLKVNLFTLGLTLNPAGQFPVSGGDWSALKKAIEGLTYDGATNFSAFKQTLPGEECLFFTDGLNTWGQPEQMGFAPTPVYTINAAANADYDWLRMIAAKTGGVFINLNETTTENALLSLTRLPLQLINVKYAGTVSEVYPSIATPVQGNCAVTGISATPQTEITLEFGYGKTVAFTKTIVLDFNKVQVQQIPLDKIWAQKKIAQLNMQYEVFKPLITDLGKKYGIVTKNTSLIVLDEVADYVQYEIEPPAELKAEYNRLIALKKTGESKIKENAIAKALNVYGNVSRWWDKDFKPVKKIISYVDLNRDSTVRRNTIVGVVTDKTGQPMSGAFVKIKGSTTGAVTDQQGRFSLLRNGRATTTIVASYVGHHNIEVAVPVNSNSVTMVLEPASQQLEEVVVVSRNAQARRQESDGDGVMYAWSNGRTDSTRVGHAQGEAERLIRNLPGVQVQSASGSVTLTAGANNTFGATSNYTTTPNNRTLARSRPAPQERRRAAPRRAADAPGFLQNGNYSTEPIRNTMAGSDFEVRTTAVPFLRIGDSARSGSFATADTSVFNAGETGYDGAVNLIDTKPEPVYIKQMDSMAGNDAYQKYFELRKSYEDMPGFYFDMAHYFFKKGDTLTGMKILSGIADLGIEDHELFKMLGYQLKQLGQYDEAINVFKKVLQWRPQEPQSYRDYALALSDGGKYQQALDTLYTALLKNYDGGVAALYPGIEEIILTEINNLIALKGNMLNTAKINKEAIKNMAVDVRVVLNWNMNDTDIDLWVIDPNGEKCFYSHKLTEAGGRISNDFTQGYGPEQFMVKKALKGKYKVMLHYYGNRQQKIAGAATILAEIFTNYGKPGQQRKVVALQMEKDADREGIPVAEFVFE